MFTGIVEDTAVVTRVAKQTDAVVRIEVQTRLDLSDTNLGDSIAVRGVCLTVVSLMNDAGSCHVAFDIGPETLAVTTLGALVVGSKVHLERAMALGTRLGGHLVSGHVDAVGTIESARLVDGALFVRVLAPPSVLQLSIPKGSITVEGCSLTINVVDALGFEVCLIPHTLQVTRFLELQPGDKVNLEADLVGKYILKILEPRLHSAG